MQQGFVGRQPIYSDGVKVFAYELFSRNSETNQKAFANGDTVTAEALLHECVDVGVGRVAAPHKAFVDVSRDFVVNDYSWLLPKDNVVLQITGDHAPDTVFLKALAHLKRNNYSIALKDLTCSDDVRPIFEVADIVKLKLRNDDHVSLARDVHEIRTFPNVKLLAEEIESHDDYQFSRYLGFDFFEGYFFCKPKQAEDQPIPPNRLSTLHLLSILQKPDVTIEELERAVGQDLAMSVRILRYLNSAMSPLPRKVTSLRHAISMVGTSQIAQWASVIWLDSIEEKPRELMKMSMIRAHACRQLGIALKCKNLDQFFTVGLLSLLDALMDRPMNTVLKDLALIAPLKEVLVNRSGPMGDAINCIEAYERCDWDRTAMPGVDEKAITEAYLGGIEWSSAVLNELNN